MAKKSKMRRLEINIPEEDYEELLAIGERQGSEFTPEQIIEDLINDFINDWTDYDD